MISYRRCFEDGGPILPGRTRTKLQIEDVPQSVRETHDDAWEQANKIVAHDVLARKGTVVIVLTTAEAIAEFGRVTCRTWARMRPAHDEVEPLLELIRAVGDAVADRKDVIVPRLEAEVASTP